MKILPSGVGRIPHLNAVILGESLATDEINFVLPNQEFATSANVV
jgi:acetyl-CoA synthetase